MCNFKTQYTKFKNSPFMLALVGGLIIAASDITWLISELFVDLEMSNHSIHLLIKLFIILPGILIGFGICIYSAKRYLSNGYVQQDTAIEIRHKRNQSNIKKLHNILSK